MYGPGMEDISQMAIQWNLLSLVEVGWLSHPPHYYHFLHVIRDEIPSYVIVCVYVCVCVCVCVCGWVGVGGCG